MKDLLHVDGETCVIQICLEFGHRTVQSQKVGISEVGHWTEQSQKVSVLDVGHWTESQKVAISEVGHWTEQSQKVSVSDVGQWTEQSQKVAVSNESVETRGILHPKEIDENCLLRVPVHEVGHPNAVLPWTAL
jgi:hypothetical protein